MWERKAQGEALVLLRLTTGDLLKPDSGAGREGGREGEKEGERGKFSNDGFTTLSPQAAKIELDSSLTMLHTACCESCITSLATAT